MPQHTFFTAPTATLLQATGLAGGPGPVPVFSGLALAIPAGITAVTGDEGTGKTTLLRLLAGELAPAAGSLVRHAGRAFRPTPADPACDGQRARDWLIALFSPLRTRSHLFTTMMTERPLSCA